ncbi:MAG: DegV family protein, partial [Clostridia bacterium]|nr:DegV family protein [Clostridia bacterium]
ATLDKIMNYVRTLQDDIKAHRVLIANSDSMEIATMLKDRLTAEFGSDLKTEFVTVNPTAGCHCGPDAVGVCFHAVHR